MGKYSNKLKSEIISPNKFPIMVMDDFYNKQQLGEIWHEIDGYNMGNTRMIWQDNANDPNRAIDKRGEALSSNSRIYLDQIYHPQHRYMSFILLHYSKLMTPPIMDIYKEIHPSTRNIENVNKDYTMISYYKNKEKYEFHKDRATHTALWWTYKEPKGFTGGDLVFKDSGETIECKNNRMVMFPSYYLHASKPVLLKDNNNIGSGKYTISHMFNINT
jgi:hypothetical protein